MLTRCYQESNLKDNPSYQDVYVCDEWLYFSNFKIWMESQVWELEGVTLHIDKDLLVKGNRVYSPDTCTFLHPKVNNFMTECKKGKPQEKIGYKVRTYSTGKVVYQARCCNPFNEGSREADSLGVFDTPEEAHEAWRARKLYYAKLLVEQGYCLNKGQEVALISRYS